MKRDVKRYAQWLQGRSDRIDGKGALSADGDYLDGYYSDPNSLAAIPDFLTPQTAAIIRRKYPETLRNRVSP